jgi:hypothetical protein
VRFRATRIELRTLPALSAFRSIEGGRFLNVRSTLLCIIVWMAIIEMTATTHCIVLNPRVGAFAAVRGRLFERDAAEARAVRHPSHSFFNNNLVRGKRSTANIDHWEEWALRQILFPRRCAGWNESIACEQRSSIDVRGAFSIIDQIITQKAAIWMIQIRASSASRSLPVRFQVFPLSIL